MRAELAAEAAAAAQLRAELADAAALRAGDAAALRAEFAATEARAFCSFQSKRRRTCQFVIEQRIQICSQTRHVLTASIPRNVLP